MDVLFAFTLSAADSAPGPPLLLILRASHLYPALGTASNLAPSPMSTDKPYRSATAPQPMPSRHLRGISLTLFLSLAAGTCC
ncbi:hypothetical protein BU16DRAFT_293497 [Lophium mytilinum]|uniref:Uncharacterized protein n=1 Tax=Lophium mytilinum TaxID=390894 RepID=A0A6A6R3B8_9PEZI|nr:hypothetical protein BU16DRAFT_293497 [Lophium mytilinum]